MKKLLAFTIAFLTTIFTIMPTTSFAATHANGTYDVNYQVNKPGSIDASIANDYFLKPAKVTVNNGKYTVQLTIKNSSWVTEFNPPGGATVVASNQDADTRTVRFTVSNPERVTIGMKIDINDIDYHHAYSVDFVFNAASIPTAQAAAPTPKNETSNNASNAGSSNATSSNVVASSQTATAGEASQTAGGEASQTTSENASGEQIENPQTSDALPYLFIIALLVSAFLFIRTKQTN